MEENEEPGDANERSHNRLAGLHHAKEEMRVAGGQHVEWPSKAEVAHDVKAKVLEPFADVDRRTGQSGELLDQVQTVLVHARLILAQC